MARSSLFLFLSMALAIVATSFLIGKIRSYQEQKIVSEGEVLPSEQAGEIEPASRDASQPGVDLRQPSPLGPEADTRRFIEGGLEIVREYRESNRRFFAAQGIEASRRARYDFDRIHSMTFLLEEEGKVQRDFKELLLRASELRVQGSEMMLKIFEEPDSSWTPKRWEETLFTLQEANQAIAKAAQKLLDLVESKESEIEDQADFYLEALSEAVKGILVVQR